MNKSNNQEWKGKWDCPEADLDELRMVERPSYDLRLRIAGYLSKTVSFQRAMRADCGQLLHWLDERVEKEHAARISELEGLALCWTTPKFIPPTGAAASLEETLDQLKEKLRTVWLRGRTSRAGGEGPI
jgi:hypothetical protein